MGHQEADLGRCEELTRALARTFRKLAQQVFVSAPEEIGLHVGKAESITRVGKGFDNGGELGRVDIALAVTFGREINEVDDARERGIVADDCSYRLGQMFPDVFRVRASSLVVERPLVGFATADDAPSCLRREVEAQQLVVALGNLLRNLPVSILFGQPLDLVVEDVGEALEEEERQQVVLELGRILLATDGAGRVP